VSNYDERGDVIYNYVESEPYKEGGDSNNDNEYDPKNDPEIKNKKKKRKIKKRRCCTYSSNDETKSNISSD
jgi:hypothetical protein